MRCCDLEGPKTQDRWLSQVTLIVAGQFSKSMGLSRPKVSEKVDARKRQAATGPRCNAARRLPIDRRGPKVVGGPRSSGGSSQAQSPRACRMAHVRVSGRKGRGEAPWSVAPWVGRGSPVQDWLALRPVPPIRSGTEPNTIKEYGRPRAQNTRIESRIHFRTLERV